MANESSISVIIPTYDESNSIRPLLILIDDVMGPSLKEIIVIDDSSRDGTDRIVMDLARANQKIVFISRPRKLGLSSAVFKGSDVSQGNIVCVMDGDLSHDPEEIPTMLNRIAEGFDIVIGSRYAPGGTITNLPIRRRLISKLLNYVARTLFGLSPNDVLSGFVMCRKTVFDSMPTRYSSPGFKFLLELLVTNRGYRVSEIPITFRDRQGGKSKATSKEGLELFLLAVQLSVWKLKMKVGLPYRER